MPVGLLAGNGELGLVLYGAPGAARVLCGHRGFYHPRHAAGYLPDLGGLQAQIQQDCLAGEFLRAAHRQLSALLEHGARQGSEGAIHAGCQLLIDQALHGEVTGYARRCDYATGELTVTWTDRMGRWQHSAFVSRADRVIVQQLIAPTPGALDCRLTLDSNLDARPQEWTFHPRAEPEWLTMQVHYEAAAGDQGYEGVTRVCCTGGEVRHHAGGLEISRADRVLLLTRLARYPGQCRVEMAAGRLRTALQALAEDYDALLARHVAVHGELYGRVTLELGADAADRALPNEALLVQQQEADRLLPAFWERIFAAGRYHYLSASDDQAPPQLIGLWTGAFAAAWNGCYVTDANLNLSVGGINTGALPELIKGYWRLLGDWLPDWRYNAQRQLGCRGFLPNGGGPAGRGNAIEADLLVEWPYQYLTGRTGWLLHPLWEYVHVSGDWAFLAEELFPVLREMGWFYEDFLTHIDAQGQLIFVPSISPENWPRAADSPLGINATFDICMARFVLQALIAACDRLGEEQGPAGGRARWARLLAQLPPYQVNDDGALAEWVWPGLLDQYNHRHASHLCTVWPLQEIHPAGDPESYQAAVRALELRLQHSQEPAAHGLLHLALCACVLQRPARVGELLRRFVDGRYFFANLFTSHDPDQQIFNSDATNTLPTLLLAMLVGSRPGTVALLPAVPDDFPVGRVTGIRCLGEITVTELCWDLRTGSVCAELHSAIAQEITLTIGASWQRRLTLPAQAPIRIEGVGEDRVICSR